MIAIVDYLALPLAIGTLIGFILTFVSLVRTMFGRRKIPFFSLGLLLIPLALIFVSRGVVLQALENVSENTDYSVSVNPEESFSPHKFVEVVIDNLYHRKGASGSHPLDKKYEIELCNEGKCFLYLVAQDSRDSGMYWVSYKSSNGINYPLGFTRLKSEKI